MNELESNALVAGNNIVSFAAGVLAADRVDLLDLMMYANIYAGQSYRVEENWISWMLYYRKQLEYSGCRLRSLIVKEPMVINSARELDDIGFSVKGTAQIANLLELTRRSFKAARLSEYARHFFEYGSGSGSLSTFQVVPCENLAEGEISFLVCGLHASATVMSDDRGGDWRVDREMVVRLAGGVYSLRRQDFSVHRERIRTRLLEIGRFNITQISI
jgi:hypothetical protein